MESRQTIAALLDASFTRQLGSGIDVEAMLQCPQYAKEVLLVCDASGDPELSRLACAFRAAAQAQPTFASVPAPAPAAVRPLRARWFKPSTWWSSPKG